jgi:4-diphosphocytidyl-2-C-methyl-D-erythritol kinase
MPSHLPAARPRIVSRNLLPKKVKQDLGDIGELGRRLFNDLEAPVVARHPEIGDVRRRLLARGALGVVMSGSGPTVVALSRSELHAQELAGEFPGALAASAPPESGRA